MKISNDTIEYLKNFSVINPSLYFREGSELRTISPQQNIFASVMIDERFPRDFAIYNLIQFINTLNIFDKPELEFDEKCVLIKENNTTVTYYYTDPSMIIKPPETNIKLDDFDFSFNLPKETLDKLRRASNIMELKDISISLKDDKVVIASTNTKIKTSNNWSIDIEPNDTNNDTTVIIDIENLKIVPLSYMVYVSEKAVKFVNEEKEIEYLIAVESRD